ncbi:hypothetical protein L5515_019340 [Caenorhabditis briggsae]|uniref:Uncharacterized protein n=1 Tax=Caenorhabditis briggsae TaxID=6238 RepID=A0AAE9FJL5_CAEBR|nr:hypothetical protein L5515_019340 [Caenorhabditis briggsae]
MHAMLASKEPYARNDLRPKLNDKFFEELADLRYGDSSVEKQKYDKIGEKFAFWKFLSDEQKKRCILDPSTSIRSKRWNVSNGIKISDEEKSEFLKQRRPLHEITCRSLLERLLKASETDKARGESIEKPLSHAFAAFPLYFDQFHFATQSLPESDIFIKGWFERKHAELRNKTFGNQQTAQEETGGTDDIQITYWQPPHESSSHNQTQQSQCVVPKEREHQATSFVQDVQKRRNQILNRNYLMDIQAFAKHLGTFQQERMAGNVSGNVLSTNSSTSSTGNVPQIPRNSPRPRIMLEKLLSGNNTSSSSIQNPKDAVQVSVENQETQKTSVSDDGQSSPEILLVNVTHPATISNRSVLQSQRAAPKPKVPATTFNPACSNALQDFVFPESSVMDGRRSEDSKMGTNARKRSSSRIEKSVGRDAPSHPIGIDNDSPQVPATSSDLTPTTATFFNSINQSIARIARDDDTRVEESSATNSSRRKQRAPKKSRIVQYANETETESGNVSGDAQRAVSQLSSRAGETGNIPQTSQPRTAFTGSRDILAEILAKEKLPTNAETLNLGAGQIWNKDSSRNPSTSGVNSRSAPQIQSDVQPEATASNPGRTHGIRDSVRTENFGIDASSGMDTIRSESRIGTDVPRSSPSRMEESVGKSLLLKIVEDVRTTNTPIGIYDDFPQGFFSVPDYSQLSAPRRNNQPSNSAWFPTLDVPESYSFAPTSLEDNRPSISSQASSSLLPNTMPTDDITHQATLSIAPPPRMISSIMNHLSTQMKKREESGCLDFSKIEVNLKATGKELDDTISFLNNLTAQLASAKQGGSYQ